MVGMYLAFLFPFVLLFAVAAYKLFTRFRAGRRFNKRLLRIIPAYNFVSPSEKRLMRYTRKARRRIA